MVQSLHLRATVPGHAMVPTTVAAGMRGCYATLLVAMAALLLLLPVDGAYAQAIQNGVQYLESVQNADGTWGGADTRQRDTAVVVDTLGLLGVSSQAFADGLGAVAGQAPRNFDELARQVTLVAPNGNVTAQTAELFAGQNVDIIDPASPDYPGRGWGIAAGFGDSAIDTALVLRGLTTAGLGTGLAVIGDTIPAGQVSPDYQVDVPPGASNIFLRAFATTGNVRFGLTQPGGGGTFTADVTPAGTPINIGPFPFAAGTWTMAVENLSGAPVTYTAEVNYVAAGGVSSTRMSRPLVYLGLTQNADGGWGLSGEGDSQIMVTAEVIRNLAGQQNAVVPGLPGAATWLAGKQNADGGFSSEPDTSNVAETALALRGVGLADPAAPLAAGVAYLQGQQLPNGSWGDDSYLTAIALQALLLDEARSAPVITSDGGAGVGADYSTNTNTAVITGDLPFGAVDVVVSDPNATVEIDFANGTFTVTVNLTPGANPITISAVDGFGRPGTSTSITITLDQALATQNLTIGTGPNFLGLRVEPVDPLTGIGLLGFLGDQAQSVSRLDAATATYETVARDNGGFLGADFTLHALDGFIVGGTGDASTDIVGGLGIPQSVDLMVGVNSLTVPNPPAGLTGMDLLPLIGDETVVSAIQGFNRETGTFETAAYDGGVPAGMAFPIEPGVSYLVFMRSALAGFVLPVDTSATIQINSPADGAVVTTSPLTVSGDVTGTAPLTVDVNGVPAVVVGGSFTADVPLVEGANPLVASLTDAALRTATDTVSVTFEIVDYSLPPGGGVVDARVFTADSAVLDQIAFFTETQIGVPAEVNYTTLLVSRISATEMLMDFQIDIVPGAAPGFVQFQIEYGLLDANQDPLGPLFGNLFDFRIEITP